MRVLLEPTSARRECLIQSRSSPLLNFRKKTTTLPLQTKSHREPLPLDENPQTEI